LTSCASVSKELTAELADCVAAELPDAYGVFGKGKSMGDNEHPLQILERRFRAIHTSP
jgi:hypothetical protein